MKVNDHVPGHRSLSTSDTPFERMALGLTGNPGAGKTSVAKIFKQYGANVIDADSLGHEMLKKNSPAYNDLVHLFGERILNERGEIQRKRLGAIVFQSPEHLKQLNRVVHPFMVNQIRKTIGDFKKSNQKGPLIVDAALLYEWDIAGLFDAVIVVTAPKELRKKRYTRMREVSAAEFEQREKKQLSEIEKKQRADIVIHNDSDLAALQNKVKKIIEG